MQPKKTDHDIDEAMSLMVEVWEGGRWLSLERGGISCAASPFANPAPGHDDALLRRLKSCQPAAREILAANRKEWAERRDEFAFAPVFREGAIVEAGLVLIEQRRVIGPGASVADPTETPRRHRACNGVIVRQGQGDKEAIAWWLWEAGMLRSDVYIIEVPESPGDDYRDVISGSHWLKSSVRPGPHQAIAQALFIAMQARSFRKEAIRANRTGWWQALAAAHYARREGISGEDACRRLSLDWNTLSRWIEKSLSFRRRTRSARMEAANPPDIETPSSDTEAFKPSPDLDETAPRGTPPTPPRTSGSAAVTDKQRALVQRLVDTHPELDPLFQEGWDKDRREASRHIGRAIEAADKLKAVAERHRQEVAGIVRAAIEG